MPERISPPKLKGHEDQNVFDLTAYRTALDAAALEKTFREGLRTFFDSVADDMRDLEHAEDGLEFALQVHNIASRLERAASVHAVDLSTESMKAFPEALTLARAAAAAARANQESGGSLQDSAARIERANRELLRAMMILARELVRIGPVSS